MIFLILESMKIFNKAYPLIFASVIFLSGCASLQPGEKSRELTLLHWNDFHSTNLPFQIKPQFPDSGKPYRVSGYANFGAYLDSLKRVNRSHLALFAGDEFQGSPVCAMTKGRSQINLIRYFAPDAMVPGNHEFDYGDSLFFAMTDTSNLPLISSNLVKKSDGSLFFPDYSWKEVNGIKIGLLGVMMDDLDRYTMPARIGLINIEPSVSAIRKAMEKVKKEKGEPDLWILLSHSGLEADQKTARQIPEIDVIISAHDHEKTVQPIRVGKTLIAEAGYRGQYIGEMKLILPAIKSDSVRYSYKLIETREGKLKPKPEIEKAVSLYENQLGKELNQVIGELQESWPMAEIEENSAANFITDGLREATGAEIGIVNAGGIRKPLNPGPVTMRDCWELQPFSNLVILFRLTGSELEQAVSYSITHSETPLHFSGIEIVLRQNNDGTFSLEKMMRDHQPLDPGKIYTIATNNYIGQNLKRTLGFDPNRVNMTETGLIDREVVIERVKKLKVIKQGTDGRRLILKTP